VIAETSIPETSKTVERLKTSALVERQVKVSGFKEAINVEIEEAALRIVKELEAFLKKVGRKLTMVAASAESMQLIMVVGSARPSVV